MITDAELLIAWRMGDERAAASLISRYAPRLHRFFATRVEEHADDLCQRTFEACVKGRQAIEEDGSSRSFRCFLFAVARRKLLNHFRSQSAGPGRIDPLETSLHDLSPTLSQVAAGSEEARLVANALRRLPLDYQITLELHYWEGLSTAEIAAALDTPVSTIKTRLGRGRRRLKEIIASLEARGSAREAALERTDELARALGRS